MFATSTNSNQNGAALHNKISFGECSGLNIDGDNEVKGILGLGGRVQSNAGEPELILYIKFKEPVNISGIKVECFEQDFEPETMQIFTNKSNLDFGDIGTIASTETINLKNNLGKQLPLKIAKFRSVSQLTIYLSNPSADKIQVNTIMFYGKEGESMDFSQIKNVNP